MTITYHAFDHVTGMYIGPDNTLDATCPVPYPSAQHALNAILAMLKANAFATPDVEIFTVLDGKKL